MATKIIFNKKPSQNNNNNNSNIYSEHTQTSSGVFINDVNRYLGWGENIFIYIYTYIVRKYSIDTACVKKTAYLREWN